MIMNQCSTMLLFQCYCWSISDHGIEVTPPGWGTTYCCICATVGLTGEDQTTCPPRRLIPEINRWGDPRWKVDVPWSDIRGRCSFWCSWPSSQQPCQWHRVELIDPRYLLTAIYKRHAFTTRNMAACVVSCSEYLFGRSSENCSSRSTLKPERSISSAYFFLFDIHWSLCRDFNWSS